MSPSTRSAFAALVLAIWSSGCAVQAGGGGITREQADAILAELRDVRRALAEQKAGPPAEVARVPARVRVSADGGTTVGAPDAAVMIVEYTDYQCPFCKRHHGGAAAGIRKHYVDTGKVRYSVRALPLSFHVNARPAAIAAHCAARQGKFRAAHDALFAVQEQLGPEFIEAAVLGVGVDADRYRACVGDPASGAAVDAQAAEANGAGITGTPGFVIGRIAGDTVEGTVVSGAKPYATFAAQLDALLALR